MNRQLALFGFRDMLASGKVPISRARILEAKELCARGDMRGSAAVLRDVRYKLEDYAKRIRV